MSDYIKVELTEGQYDKISRIGITKLEVASIGCKMTIGGGSSDFEMTIMDKDRFNQPSSDSEALDMIDTTSNQVESLANNSESPNSSEWENGDECMWNGIECTFIGMSISHPSIAIVEYLKGLVSINDRVYVDELSKPESPEQKAERERLEIVKKACLTVRHDYGLMTESDRNFLEKCGMEWLKAFEKVGCIKEQK